MRITSARYDPFYFVAYVYVVWIDGLLEFFFSLLSDTFIYRIWETFVLETNSSDTEALAKNSF